MSSNVVVVVQNNFLSKYDIENEKKNKKKINTREELKNYKRYWQQLSTKVRLLSILLKLKYFFILLENMDISINENCLKTWITI